MKISGSTALVTGANRGLGLELVQALLARGATRVYAASRTPGDVPEGAVALRLDLTDPASIAEAVAVAGDVDLLVNNAGISQDVDVFGPDGSTELRRQFETNTVGTLDVTRAFAPVLGRNGGGALVNVLSVLSWLTTPPIAGYAAAKAASWSLTNATRGHLAAQGTLVVGAHVGYMDTRMTEGVDAPKLAPADFARQVLDAVEAGEDEVLGDDVSRTVKSVLAGPPSALTM